MEQNKKIEHNILVTRSSLPPMEEYIEEIRDIWETHWMTNMGEKHQRLQAELEKYLMVDHVALMVNGHMALELALQGMELSGEVITTPFTFASTTHAIIRNGLTPVFCDINEQNYTMDVTKIEDLITDRTTAILPVHVYGNVCDIEEIERIAGKHHLKVLYDAAHTFGETYHGRGVSSFGDCSALSFHATKVFNTIEGGAVCYHDEAFGQELYYLKNFGIRDEETVKLVGANAKMNEFAAAMGLCNLRHVTEEIEKRRRVAETYIAGLSGIDGLDYWKPQEGVKPNYAYYPVVFDEVKLGVNRDQIFDMLAEHGIHARKYFYPITNSFDCFHGQFDPKQTPIALKISKQVLTLPMYADLEIGTVEEITRLIREYLARRN